MFVLKEEHEISGWMDVVKLATDGVNRIVRQTARRQNHVAHCECASVGADLPLIVSDHANLRS